MKKVFALAMIVLAAGLSMQGCAGMQVDASQMTDCFLACLQDTIWVIKDGVKVPVVPEDYRLLIWNRDTGQFELKDKAE